MESSNRFNVLLQDTDENNTENYSVDDKKMTPEEKDVTNAGSGVISETIEEIEAKVDEIISAMNHFPNKISSRLWKDGDEFTDVCMSMVEFSDYFIATLKEHGGYSLDELFFVLEHEHVDSYSLPPTRSTLFEYILYRLGKSHMLLKRQDYDILDGLCKAQKEKIRFSAVIGGRDVANNTMAEFGDSGLALIESNVKDYEVVAKICSYLQRINRITFDYHQMFGKPEKGIKAVDPHTFEYFTTVRKWTDKSGLCYYNSYIKLPYNAGSGAGKRDSKPNSKIDTRNFNQLLAVLSFVKGQMNPHSIRESKPGSKASSSSSSSSSSLKNKHK
jgi:hypothetical protein